MNIMELLYENVRRIRIGRVKLPIKGIVQITGGNEVGKSTFLNAIKWSLAGRAGVPDHVVTESEKKGKLEMLIGDDDRQPLYTVVLDFKATSPSVLTVKDATTGQKIESPQTLLNKFWNDVSLQPLAFANSSAKVQREMLLKAMKPPVDDVFTELTGQATDVDDPLAVLDAAYKAAYNERTAAGQRMRALEAQYQGYRDVPDGLVYTDPAELLKQRTGLDRQWQKYDASKRALQGVSARIAAIMVELETLYEQEKQYEAEVNSVDATIPSQISAIDDQINNSELAAKSMQKAAMKPTVTAAQTDHAEVDERCAELLKYKQTLVENSFMPLPELSFNDDGEVLYENEPLEARGISRRLLIGVAIGAALKPLLKVILLDEGSEIGSDVMQELNDWAVKNGYLIIMAREVRSGNDIVSFSIEDGTVEEVV